MESEGDIALLLDDSAPQQDSTKRSVKSIIIQVLWVLWWLIIYSLSIVVVVGFSFIQKRFIPRDHNKSSNDLVGKYYTLKKAYFGLLLHMIGGTLALFTGPVQFQQLIRKKAIIVHKIFGYIYYSGIVIGFVGAVWLIPFAAGGMTNYFAFSILAMVWAVCNTTSFYYIKFGFGVTKERRIQLHREWMIRSFAATAAAITLRLWLMVLILFGIYVLHNDPSTAFMDAYKTVSWLSAVPNLMVAELYIRLSEPAPQVTADEETKRIN